MSNSVQDNRSVQGAVGARVIEPMTEDQLKKLVAMPKDEFNALPLETLVAYWKGTTQQLAGNCVFALKNLRTKSGGGAMLNMATGEIRAWESDFMDSLDLIGYVIDRDKYFESKHVAKKKRPNTSLTGREGGT